jgi:uncharacterized protein YaaN involved in tellurite resistance
MDKHKSRALFQSGKVMPESSISKMLTPLTPQLTQSQQKQNQITVSLGKMVNDNPSINRQPLEHPGFQPLAVKKMVDSNIRSLTTNTRVISLLQAMDTPLGILSYGQQEMDNIAEKSDLALQQIDDSNVDFITSQLSSILTLAQQYKPTGSQNHQSRLMNLVDSVKSLLVDVKETGLSQLNTISEQMDRVVSQIDSSTLSISDKVNNLTQLYVDNLNDYNELTSLIEDAKTAVVIKQNEYDNIINNSNLTPIELEQANRLQQQIDRLDKKLMTFEKMQFMAMQTAPTIRDIQENGYTLLEKFHTIKRVTIPMWKRQARLLSDQQALSKGVALANSVDDANNLLILQASSRHKENSIATAKAGQRDVVDTQTLLAVNQTLIDTFAEVLSIDNAARIARQQSRQLIEDGKKAYMAVIQQK